MAYVTGTAADMNQLKSAILAACATNGWTQVGDIISKSGCHMMITVGNSTRLDFQVGNGSSSGAITDPAPAATYVIAVLSSEPLVFPLTYYIHIHGNEVYMIVNWGIDNYSIHGFGKSPITGMPGTGVWCAGTAFTASDDVIGWSYGCNRGQYYPGSSNSARMGLFTTYDAESSGSAGCFVHHGLTGWSGGGAAGGVIARTYRACKDLNFYDNPGTNPIGQTTLVPIQPHIDRGSSKISLVADLVHARYCRLDTLSPGDVITLGGDRWRVYPMYKKNSTNRNGSNTSSGTFGYAIKYDGP